MDQCDLGCHPRCDARRGVQGDRLPDQISAFRRHLMLGAKLASSIRAVYFEAILSKISRNQSEIVQSCPAKRRFFVNNRTTDAPHSKAAEDIRAKTMGAEKLRRTGLQDQQRHCTVPYLEYQRRRPISIVSMP